MNNNMTKLTQSERLAKVEEKTDGIDYKIDKLDSKIDTVIDKLDEKYASKWVEDAMKFVILAFATAIVGAFVKMVIIDNPKTGVIQKVAEYHIERLF